MTSCFLGLSSKDPVLTKPLLQKVLPDGSGPFFYPPIHVAIKGGDIFQDKQNRFFCHFLGHIDNRATLFTLLQQKADSSLKNSELLCSLYMESGKMIFQKAQGNFLCFLCDEKKQKFFIYRSGLSSHPLYFVEQEEFIFSSEIKLLARYPKIAKKTSSTALAAYLQLGFVPSPLSIFFGARELLPGYLLQYTANKQVQLQQLQKTETLLLDKPPINTSFPPVDLHKCVDFIFKLDSPQCRLFFPSIFQSTNKSFDDTTELYQKKESRVLISSFVKTIHKLSPAFSKWYFSIKKKLPQFEQFKNQAIFSSKEMKRYFPNLSQFPIYPFFAKMTFEKHIENLEDLLLNEMSLFFPYLQHFKTKADFASFKATLINQFLLNQPATGHLFSSKSKESMIAVIKEGTLIDLDILYIKNFKKWNSLQLWTVFVLEVWMRLFIDNLPELGTVDLVRQDLFNDIVLQ